MVSDLWALDSTMCANANVSRFHAICHRTGFTPLPFLNSSLMTCPILSQHFSFLGIPHSSQACISFASIILRLCTTSSFECWVRVMPRNKVHVAANQSACRRSSVKSSDLAAAFPLRQNPHYPTTHLGDQDHDAFKATRHGFDRSFQSIVPELCHGRRR